MTETKHVYKALASILKEMSVEKGGTLPGNMGGKPYITAVDLNAEAKRQFVDNDLVLIVNEKLVRHENLVIKDRITVSTLIEGSYQLVSTVDESSITFSGIGDGLAIGTAVSSNIASTNALKNALLRLLLVTEQSSEDAAKDGIPEALEGKATAAAKETIDKVRSDITAYINDDKNSFDGQKVNALGEKILGIGQAQFKTLDHYTKIRDELKVLIDQEQKTGEIAEV